MAAEGDLQKEVRTHWRGYSMFLTLMKAGTLVSLLVALLVIFLISN